MIYPEQLADYYSTSWNATEFDDQFEILMDNEAFVAMTTAGFVRLNIIEKIGEIIKGFLGGTDYSQRHRVQAAWLKFLYYGEAHHLLKEGQIERLRHRISYPYEHFDIAIDQLFKEVSDYHQYFNESTSEHLSKLRNIVTDYHRHHAASLRPGFWTRLCIPPLLDSRKLFLFGDTPLQLSEKALEQQANPHLAFAYLQKAFDLKNDSPGFQKKLAVQLQELENSYFSELTEQQQQKIQELWIELGQTAFENELSDLASSYLERALRIDYKNAETRLQVGKLYLANEEYRSAQPFLAELQKAFSQDFQMQIKVGHAYWQLDQFKEAVKAYETALSTNQKQMGKLSSHQKQIAFAYHQLGIAHLKQFISNGTITEAITFLLAAIEADPITLNYQENLYEAYVLQWQASSVNFAALHGEEWLKFVAISQATVIKKWKSQIIQILLGCSEQYFKAHQNQKAHACLQKGIDLFKDDVNIKIQAIDMAIRYGDWHPFKSKLDDWESEYYANPYLKQKIGDAYWHSDQNQAVAIYQKSLNLFDQRLLLCQDEAERKDCQQQMADMKARIGKTHLQVKPGLFKGVPFDAAIKNFEQAALIDPSHYASLLFDACLAAAQVEKQRPLLLRDTNKIIELYQKAFQALRQKGEYLIELLQLCIDSQRHDDAVAIYYDIQKQPWAEELEVPSTIFSELAKKLFEHKEYEATLDCLRQAYELEPQNQKYKKDYFQLTLALAKDKYQKLQKSRAKDKQEATSTQYLLEIAESLEACWNEEFDQVKQLEKPYQEMFAKIYHSLADCYVQRCLLPQPKKEMAKITIKKHQEQHQAEIQQALDYYTTALNYQPENASLHFDKGLLLDWIVNYEEAIKEFELAVKYQPCNPFYHKMLALLYFSVYYDTEKCEKHHQLAQKYTSPSFAQDYQIWADEFMSQVKTKQIDPHSYTQKKGWFS
jgi:tetratricopeptide (TPR) repeat protein